MKVIETDQGQNHHAGASSSQDGLTVIIPGQEVITLDVPLPDLPDEKLYPLIPAVIADMISEDVTQVHTALLPSPYDGKKRLLVTSQETMQQARQHCLDKGGIMTAAWPDYMLVPIPESVESLDPDVKAQHLICAIDDNGMVMARRGDGSGFTLEEALAKVMIDSEDYRAVVDTVDREQLSSADTIPAGPGLACGDFSPAPPLSSYFTLFRRGLIFAFAALCFWGGLLYWQTDQLQQARSDHDKAAAALFQQAFPDVKRVVNVEAQLRNKLAGMGGAGAGDDFLSISRPLFGALDRSQGVRLDSLLFDQGRSGGLQIMVSALDFAAIETFKQFLNQQGFVIDDRGSQMQEGQVISTMSLRRQATAPGGQP